MSDTHDAGHAPATPEKKSASATFGGAKSAPWFIVLPVTLVIASVLIYLFFFFGRKKEESTETGDVPTTGSVQYTPIVVEFPTEGEMTIRSSKPGKAWLDPSKTYIRPTGPAVYTFAKDRSVVFYDTASNQKLNVNNDKWTKWFPAGDYYISPYKRDSIYFRWWQN